MGIRFGSVCSGIEAASVAWHPLGWRAAWLSEIEPFPSRVLAHHYPDVPNLGDMTTIAARVRSGEVEAPDVLVGGTPCQSFSVAGLRGGLSDERGNLALEFVRIADAIDDRRPTPAWILWENVPGVLSDKGNAFGCFLAGLVGADAPLVPLDGWRNAGVVAGPRRVAAWRILNSEFFGVAQRRRRIFVLARGGAGAWACADALLPLGESVSRNPPARRAQREAVAETLGGGSSARGWADDTDRMTFVPTVSPALKARDAKGPSSDGDGDGAPLVAHSLRGEGHDASEDGTGRGVPLVFDETQITSPTNRCQPREGDPSHPLAAGARPPTIAFHNRQDPDVSGVVTHPLGAKDNGLGVCIPDVAQPVRGNIYNNSDPGMEASMHVALGGARRLTPRECARLQGFPDEYLDMPGAADGGKYRALGNSMAVPVMNYIGRRIAAVSP